MEYLVTVEDWIRCTTEITVEANSPEEAHEKALRLFEEGDCEVGKVDWDSSKDMEVLSVEPF